MNDLIIHDQIADEGTEGASTGKSSFVTSGAGSIARTPQLAFAKLQALNGRSLPTATPIHLSDAEFNLAIKDLLRSRDQKTEEYLKWAGNRKFSSRAEAILGIVKKASISVAKSGYNDPAMERIMLERIEAGKRHGTPLYLPLLLGGIKTPNPLKTGQNVLPDLAEWQAWLQFDALARAVDGIVVPIPDAGLVADLLEFAPEDVSRHTRQANEDVGMLGLSERVRLPETLDFLPVEWSQTVKSITTAIRERSKADEETSQRVRDQAWSLQFITNVRKLALSNHDHILLGAALAGDRAGTPESILRLADELAAQALDRTPIYMAVNEAIRQHDLAGRIVEAFSGCREHLRLSVHAKPFEARPRLVFKKNRLVASMGLLPMHGVGMRESNENNHTYGIGFDLVNRVEGSRPVYHRGRFMWFDSAPRSNSERPNPS